MSLDHPNSKKLVLVKAYAGVHLFHWAAAGGAYPTTWYTETPLWITSIKESGIDLTEQPSIAAVEADTGWYNDRAAGRVYVRPNFGGIYDNIYQAMAHFRWGNHPRAATGGAYEPRLATAPDLSLRIPPLFTLGLNEGGGNVEVEQSQGSTPETPGLFDGLDLDWSAGWVEVLAGAEPVY